MPRLARHGGTQSDKPTFDAILAGHCNRFGQQIGQTCQSLEVIRHARMRENPHPLHVVVKLLSGPIDVDKMDYLMRDSLHAGVPYGRNFDQSRLINSLCLNEMGDGLAITDKGKTAAEMMVFARYVMFSEVYWHHAVRSATAMLQRAFLMLHESLDIDSLFRMSQRPMTEAMLAAAGECGASIADVSWADAGRIMGLSSNSVVNACESEIPGRNDQEIYDSRLPT